MARVYTKNTTQKPLQNYRIYSGLKICISSQRELLIYNQKEEDHLYKEGHFLFLYLFPQTTNVIAVTVSQIIMLQLGKLRVKVKLAHVLNQLSELMNLKLNVL